MQREQEESKSKDATTEPDGDASSMARMEARLKHVELLNAGLIHEFNNTIGIISGFAELAKLDPVASASVRQAIDQILAATRHGRQLVQDSGNALHERPIRGRKVNFSVLLDEVRDLLEPDTSQDITIEWRWEEAPTQFTADATHIRLILINLVHNAIRAIGRKGRITVTASQFECRSTTDIGGSATIDAGQYLLLSVKDNGCGITSEWQDKVMQPFFTTHEESGGTGMGLAVVASLALRYNGATKLDSIAGEGTWVQVYLKTQ